MPPIILASSSKYRQHLLAKLGLDFSSCSPDIDESALFAEEPAAQALRLAQQKTRAVEKTYPNHLIIGSDQVACINNTILQKPGNHDNAVEQLTQCSGKAVSFHTGIALLNSASGHLQASIETYKVYFRPLSTSEIDQYLRLEKPYDCAGSFKVEGLGISLFEKLEGSDPNSLIGLPLIRLIDFLANENISALERNFKYTSE